MRYLALPCTIAALHGRGSSGCAALAPDWKRLSHNHDSKSEGAPNDTASTTVHRGHAAAWPRTHHTTKLPPLCRRVRKILQHQSGTSGSRGDPAVRTTPVTCEEALPADNQHLRLFC